MQELLGTTAKDIGPADELRLNDFGRVYTPNILVEEVVIEICNAKNVVKLPESKPGAMPKIQLGHRLPQRVRWPVSPQRTSTSSALEGAPDCS